MQGCGEVKKAIGITEEVRKKNGCQVVQVGLIDMEGVWSNAYAEMWGLIVSAEKKTIKNCESIFNFRGSTNVMDSYTFQMKILTVKHSCHQ